ncbi:hypothetical protein ACSBLW_05790 [Thioclava sp. FR2]|uniref:hypothetical protein n=1 Tax=Thioclava sp. FR2 TaxID=3445780 RepID=UPI003EC14007
MSNHEIEDVLSSIRRLVSEDLRPTPKADAAAPRAPSKPEASAGAAKLLLTPSLRVIEEPTAVADDHAHEEGEDFSDNAIDDGQVADQNQAAFSASDDDIASFGATDGDEVQDVIARLGAAVGEGDEEWESPVGDPPAWEDVALSDSQSAAVSQSRLHFRPTEADNEESGPEFLEDDAASDFEAQNFEDNTPADVDYADDLAEAEEEPVAEKRRFVSPPDDDWAAAAEAEVRAELEREVEENTSSMFTGAEFTYDEEMLRDLVRDIIREELAGTLGERITRNVRKLVRAEIARALAVREFE